MIIIGHPSDAQASSEAGPATPPSNSFKFRGRTLILIPLIISVLYYCSVMMPMVIGPVREEIWFTFGVFLVACIMLSMLAAPVAMIVLIFRVLGRTYDLITQIGIMLTLNALMIFGTAYLVKHSSREIFSIMTHNAAPLVAGIEAYRRDNGTYPRNLQALKPKYLNEIPNAFLYRLHFDYCRDGKDCLFNKYPTGGFELEVKTIHGELIYWPNRQYPENAGFDPPIKINDWAYFSSTD